MTYYIKMGNTYRQAANAAIDLKDALPAGTYTLRFDPQSNQFFYEISDNFDLPSKLYGDTDRNADRIINTFKDRPHTTGVLLEGEKGSGKTLLAKTISLKMIEEGVPTIIVNSAYHGEIFNSFVQTIQQPAVFIFDEFEKVYDLEAQQQVLTLFDGVYPTKKLFLITVNDKYRIDNHMRNRPGRIYYMLNFEGLSPEFIKEYAEEHLKDQTQIEGLITVSYLFPKFNFDMLKALVEEMNRYNETAAQVVRLLNTKPDGGRDTFDLKLIIGGEPANEKHYSTEWSGNPFNVVAVEWEDDNEDNEDGYKMYMFQNTDLKKIDGVEGKYVYQNSDGDSIVLTRKKGKTFDWADLVA